MCYRVKRAAQQVIERTPLGKIHIRKQENGTEREGIGRFKCEE